MRSKQEWSTPRTFANAAQEGGIVRSQPARHAVPSTTDMLKKSKFHIFYVHVRSWNELSDVYVSSDFPLEKIPLLKCNPGSWRTKLLSQSQVNLTVKIDFGYEKCELK